MVAVAGVAARTSSLLRAAEVAHERLLLPNETQAASSTLRNPSGLPALG